MILNELSENSQQVTTHLPQKLFSHKVVLPADTTFVQINRAKRKCIILTLFRLGFLRVVQIGGGWGGGGQKVPAAYNSKTIEIWWSSKGSLAN